VKFRFATLAGLVIIGALGVVTPAAAQTVELASSEEHGAYLVGPQALSLYLFLPDDAQQSTCDGGCAVGWPPLLVEGAAEAGEGVDDDLLGTVVRADGSVQVTYGGWPLYSFRRDRKAGDVAGQGVGDQWYLVSPAGEAIGRTASATPGQAEAETSTVAFPPEVKALVDEGRVVYSSFCAGCHGQQGSEALSTHVAILAGNKNAVGDARRVIRQVVHGGTYMPSFGPMLSDRDVAAVATYIRNAWGNEFGTVTEEEVSEQR
jgi:predicted lipoprotein with Yx(FWY)xxD motif/cytochrome c5